LAVGDNLSAARRIIASIMAKKINPAKSGALLIVGILTTILAAMLIFVSMKYTIKF